MLFEEDAIQSLEHPELNMRAKLPVEILGATGAVGQKLIEILSDHSWFQVDRVMASEASVGRKVEDIIAGPVLSEVGELEIEPCIPKSPGRLVFSALPADKASEIDQAFVAQKAVVVSLSSAHRDSAPLVIPEVNASAVESLAGVGNGMVVAKPNCTVTGLTLALKALQQFGLKSVSVVTMQAISGAGISALSANAMLDNVIPYISGEEEKIETEPQRILDDRFPISASCNRVPVTDGHLMSVAVTLKEQVGQEEVVKAFQDFTSPVTEIHLPSAPHHPIHYFDNPTFPQPKYHRMLEKGMAISIGNVRPCPLHSFKFNVLVNNMVRGAAGNAVLTAELLVKKGFVLW